MVYKILLKQSLHEYGVIWKLKVDVNKILKEEKQTFVNVKLRKPKYPD